MTNCYFKQEVNVRFVRYASDIINTWKYLLRVRAGILKDEVDLAISMERKAINISG